MKRDLLYADPEPETGSPYKYQSALFEENRKGILRAARNRVRDQRCHCCQAEGVRYMGLSSQKC